jgi:hypothetical protein
MVPSLTANLQSWRSRQRKTKFQNEVINALVAWKNQERFLAKGTIELSGAGNTFARKRVKL